MRGAVGVQVADRSEHVLEQGVLRLPGGRLPPAAEIDGEDPEPLRGEVGGDRVPALLREGGAVREHDPVATVLAVEIGVDRATVGGREGDEARRLGRERRASEGA